MEYQKITKLLDDRTNQTSKFRRTNWLEINDESKGRYDNSNIRFKTPMLRSSLCDYSYAYIHVKGTITVPNTAAAVEAVSNTNKKVIFKNCVPFTDCITEINDTQIDDAQKIDVVMPMYNLTQHSAAYSKTSASLWQYYRDEPALDYNNNIIDFPDNSNNSASFKFKQQITGQTGNGGSKDVEIMVPLNYLSNIWRTLEMPLINCEISLQLKWANKCILVAGAANNKNPSFQINDTKLYVPVVTLSTQENIKLLKQLESGFKRTNNWNKYLAKTTNQAQNRYLDYLIDPSFQGINRLFVLSFENDNDRESYKQYYLSKVEIKNYNVSIDGRNFFDQPIKSKLKTYDNIRKIATCQGDDYTTGCLLDYPYFKNYYKLIAVDLS